MIVTAETASFPRLSASTSYTIRVQARDSEGVFSDEVALSTATTATPAPAGLADSDGVPKETPAETSAFGRAAELALPGSVTPAIVSAVRSAASDPACPWERQGVLCMRLTAEFEFRDAQIAEPIPSGLAEVGAFLKANPRTAVELQGHTDDRGADDVNLKLSNERAEAVKNYFVSEQGIEASRLSTKGFGKSKPAATNETDEGRAKNRRVVAVLEWQGTRR
jgi:outer membrane protein OmpA-like peptidoglycan-associated protein